MKTTQPKNPDRRSGFLIVPSQDSGPCVYSRANRTGFRFYPDRVPRAIRTVPRGRCNGALTNRNRRLGGRSRFIENVVQKNGWKSMQTVANQRADFSNCGRSPDSWAVGGTFREAGGRCVTSVGRGNGLAVCIFDCGGCSILWCACLLAD